ncbi:MAG: glutaredoxin [Planctomycetota bacterium]|nr:glutaredoxin [Planctomycetota bacterium]
MILIFGKQGCGLCDAAKQKMDILGIDYLFVDAENLPENWRDLDIAGAMAEYQMHDRLPWIQIDGCWYDYPAAMKILKSRSANERQ